MAKILSVATHATDDPTKCTMAFVTAIGAVGADLEVEIALLGEAAYLAKKEIAKTIHGVGFAPMPELIQQVVKANVPVFV